LKKKKKKKGNKMKVPNSIKNRGAFVQKALARGTSTSEFMKGRGGFGVRSFAGHDV